MHMTFQSAEGEIEGERALRRTIVQCAEERESLGAIGVRLTRRSPSTRRFASQSAFVRVVRLARWGIWHCARIADEALAGVAPAVRGWDSTLLNVRLPQI